jgi:hypothetical protein
MRITCKSKQQFRKWLRAEIRQLSDEYPDLNQCEDAANTVRQAGRIAPLLGYPMLAKRCAITTPSLAFPTARSLLAECLAAIESESDLLTAQECAPSRTILDGPVRLRGLVWYPIPFNWRCEWLAC